MNHDDTGRSVLFVSLSLTPDHAIFDEAGMTSDGGELLLKAVDERLGLTEALAGCIRDDRQESKVKHRLLDPLRQRVFGLALGYPDANDATGLAHDPLHKLLLDRDPVRGERLASQPTISRLENGVGRGELLAMSKGLADVVLRRHMGSRSISFAVVSGGARGGIARHSRI